MIAASMLRASLSVLMIVPMVCSASCARRSPGGFTPEMAAEGIRTSPTFTTRTGSAVGRELIEVVAIRRIASQAIEVEFTWRDAAPPAGQTTAPVRTSMALFRQLGPDAWGLRALYKVE